MDLKEALDASYGGPVVETHKGNNHNAPAARVDSTPTPGRSSRSEECPLKLYLII